MTTKTKVKAKNKISRKDMIEIAKKAEFMIKLRDALKIIGIYLD